MDLKRIEKTQKNLEPITQIYANDCQKSPRAPDSLADIFLRFDFFFYNNEEKINPPFSLEGTP